MTQAIIIADKQYDWSARLAIYSLRIFGQFNGKIILVGQIKRPAFDDFHNVTFLNIDNIVDSFNLKPTSGPFRLPQYKPFIIRKLYNNEPTIYLDADTFIARKLNPENINSLECCVTEKRNDLISQNDTVLWNIPFAPTEQINTGVLFINDISVLDEWCRVFEEACTDGNKYQYLMQRQPWSYDQIGLIIALSRGPVIPKTNLDKKYNYEIAYYASKFGMMEAWQYANEQAIVIHFTNWKINNYAEALEIYNRWPDSIVRQRFLASVNAIERLRETMPPVIPLPNDIRAKKATAFVTHVNISDHVLLGLTQGIGNVIMATPSIKALTSMGLKVDVLNGGFNNGAEIALKDMPNVKVIDEIEAENRRYLIGIQTVWPRNGLDKFCTQVRCAGNFANAWNNYIFAHEVEMNMGPAYSLGYKGNIPELYCYSELNPADALIPENKYVGIHVCRIYNTQFYANRAIRYPHILSHKLAEAGFIPVIIGHKDCVKDRTIYHPDTIFKDGLPLGQTAALIRNLDCMINEDSGIMHVTAAMDTPQIAIFGPTSVVKNRPWSNKAAIIHPNVNCAPCQFTNKAQTCGNNFCMEVDIDYVVKTVKSMIKQFPKQANRSYLPVDDERDYTEMWKKCINTNGESYYLSERQHSYNQVKRLIPEGSTVFDYGCGLGYISRQLFKEKNCIVYGCDANEFAVNEINKYLNEHCTGRIENHFYVGTHIQDMGIGKFDFLIFSHILEHVKDPVRLVQYAKCFTRNIIIVLPNNCLKRGDHIHMAWSSFKEFESMFPDAKNVTGEYPSKLSPAFKNPIYMINVREKCQSTALK